MPTAAYGRYSDKDQRETSIDDQLRRCHQVAAREGLTLDPQFIFADSAITGKAQGTAKRRQYRRLLDAIEAREVTALVADEISRLTRDVKEGGHLMLYVEELGLRVITADGIDTTREGWRTIWMAKLMTASIEVDATSHRTVRGMLGQLERGYQIAQAPFGYRPEKDMLPSGKVLGTRWVIHEPEAQVIRDMYAWRASGWSASAIAARLQKDQVLPPGTTRKDGQPYWRAASVYRLLGNTIYRGEFQWNGSTFTRSRARRRRKEVEVQAFARPELRIVPDTAWYACNGQRSGNGRSPRGGGKHVFAGLVQCSDCGGHLAVGGNKRSQTLYCPQCENAVRVGGRETWLGYSSVGAARAALNWVLEAQFTGAVVAEFHHRLKARLEEGPAKEEQELKQREVELQATAQRLKTLLMNPNLAPELFEPELESTSQALRAVKHRLETLRESSRRITPQTLQLQMEVRPLELLRQLLDGTEETYKVRATLRRLLSQFRFAARPRRGSSVFRIALRPGVCTAEMSDTAVIDSTEVVFEVVASTGPHRPVRWNVSGRLLT